MFFGLSMLCKQITIPSILPIGFYIVSALYAEGRELQRRKAWLFGYSKCA